MRIRFINSRFIDWACWAMVGLAFLPALGQAQRVILSENFDDDAPDGLPNTLDGYARSTTRDGDNDPSKAAVTGGQFADPFGPGNQSLLLYNPRGTTQMAVTWINEFDDNPAAFRNGSIEFDLYLDDPQGYWSYLDLRIGYGNAERKAVTTVNAADVTVWNSFRVQNIEGADKPIEQVADDGNRFVSGVVPVYTDGALDLMGAARKFHVRYDFDGRGSTFLNPPKYTMTISDQKIEWDDGLDEHIWIVNSSFQFATGINIISFLTDASAQNAGSGVGTDQHTGNVYIDNLLVINNDLPPLNGPDLNGDGAVDASDAGIMFGAWGSADPLADLTHDGIVDAADAGVMFGAWTGDAGPANAVPEPTGATAILGLVASYALSLRRTAKLAKTQLTNRDQLGTMRPWKVNTSIAGVTN